MKQLIAPTTALAHATLRIADDEFKSIGQSGLTGEEAVTFEILLDVWTPIEPAVTMVAGENYIQIAGPGVYRLTKSITASPVGVYLSE